MNFTPTDIEGFATRISAAGMTDNELAILDHLIALAEDHTGIEVAGFAATLDTRIGGILGITLGGGSPGVFKAETNGVRLGGGSPTIFKAETNGVTLGGGTPGI